MRCQWIVRRTMQPAPGGQRRWDRAYQEMLAWMEGPADEPVGASRGPGGLMVVRASRGRAGLPGGRRRRGRRRRRSAA